MPACLPWSRELGQACKITADVALVQQQLQVATEVVWALSGRRFGICPLEVRPCRRRCLSAIPDGYSLWGGYFGEWSWPVAQRLIWESCACPTDDCGCGATERIRLRGPVYAIDEVWVDGAQLPVTGAYRVDEFRDLVRLDGGKWPDCGDLLANEDEPGSFVLKYRYGTPPPTTGVIAVQEMGCELLKAYLGQECRLPRRVTSISRQGVSFAMLDPMDFLDHGRTGLYNVDLFLSAYNPAGLQSRGKVFRADARPRSRRVDT